MKPLNNTKSIKLIKRKCSSDEYNIKLDEIAFQCSEENHLYKDQSYDTICDSLSIFKSLGISIGKLKKWKSKLPFIYPWDEQYNSERLNVNRYWNIFPLIISLCKTEEDVVASFIIAKTYKIHISCRGGKHCALPFSLTHGMVIDQYKRKELYCSSHG